MYILLYAFLASTPLLLFPKLARTSKAHGISFISNFRCSIVQARHGQLQP